MTSTNLCEYSLVAVILIILCGQPNIPCMHFSPAKRTVMIPTLMRFASRLSGKLAMDVFTRHCYFIADEMLLALQSCNFIRHI